MNQVSRKQVSVPCQHIHLVLWASTRPLVHIPCPTGCRVLVLVLVSVKLTSVLHLWIFIYLYICIYRLYLNYIITFSIYAKVINLIFNIIKKSGREQVHGTGEVRVLPPGFPGTKFPVRGAGSSAADCAGRWHDAEAAHPSAPFAPGAAVADMAGQGLLGGTVQAGQHWGQDITGSSTASPAHFPRSRRRWDHRERSG